MPGCYSETGQGVYIANFVTSRNLPNPRRQRREILVDISSSTMLQPGRNTSAAESSAVAAGG
jgi:hypothetical protein